MKLPKYNSPFRILNFGFNICLLFVFLNFGFAQSANAEEISIVVSPPRYDVDVQPGETVQKTVKVTNGGEADVTIIPSIHNFIVMDDKGTPVKVTESSSGRFLASPWFNFDASQFTLAPKQSREVVVVVAVPADALPGGHYAGIFFEPVGTDINAGSGTALTAQVGSLFGITVAGDIQYGALIKDFRTSTPIFEFGPVDFSATIENQSDTHIRPASSITVKNMFGREIDTLVLDEVNIFPFTSRTLETEWEQVWGFGRYTAILTAAYGPGLTAERVLYFWIMPWRVIAAVLILLGVIIVVYISVKRHLHHRRDDRDSQIDQLKRRIVELENKQ